MRALIPIAAFDLDGTCISGQSGKLFSFYLFKHGYFSPLQVLRLAWWGMSYKLHLPMDQNTSREIIMAALSERTKAEVDDIMLKFYEEELSHRVRPAAMKEIQTRKDEGCTILLVSATFEPIALNAAGSLGMDAVLATSMATDDTGLLYTTQVEGEVMSGIEKLRAVTSWADHHVGHGQWYLKCAYGDHHSDAPMLAAARHAFAVCPGTTLKRKAKKAGWTIVDWS